MKILIIGGTKFIGPYVVRDLLGLGHEVVLFHRGNSNNHLSEVAEILGDRNQLSHYRKLRRVNPHYFSIPIIYPAYSLNPFKHRHSM